MQFDLSRILYSAVFLGVLKCSFCLTVYGDQFDGIKLRTPSGYTPRYIEVVDEARTSKNVRTSTQHKGQLVNSTINGTTTRTTIFEYLAPDIRKFEISNEKIESIIEQDGREFTSKGYPRLIGKSVIGTLANEQWNCRLMSGSPTKAEQEVLDSFEIFLIGKNEMIPQGNLHVGEEWELPVSSIQVLAGLTNSQPIEASGRMRFDEVVDYQNERCAQLSYSLKYVGILANTGQSESTSTVELAGKMYRSIENFVNLHNSSSGTLNNIQSLNGSMKTSMQGMLDIRTTTTLKGDQAEGE